MTGFKDSADAWSKVWTDAQKQYMDAWMGLSRDSGHWPGAQASAPWGGGAWADSMQQWSRLMSQAMPGDSQNVNTRLFDLGKSFMSMGETLWSMMQQGNAMAGEACDWQEMMTNAFKGVTNEAAGSAQSKDPWSGFATFWGLPMDTWQKLACSFTPMPGEMGKALRPDGAEAPSEMNRAIRQMLSLPPVGYTREWQTQGQEWAELMLEYNAAMQEFMQLLGSVGQKATELFGKKLNAISKQDKSLEGLRDAYDLWVDCGEEAYAEAVATPDFPHLQAKMVNALMRLKRHEQSMLDEAMTAMNIPTRREIDTTHKHVYNLQRQLSALQDTIEDLTESLQQAEVAAPAVAAPAAAPAKAAAPARKKTAVKKASAKKPAAQSGAAPKRNKNKE